MKQEDQTMMNFATQIEDDCYTEPKVVYVHQHLSKQLLPGTTTVQCNDVRLE